MTEAQYQEILDRLTALETDVSELKEAYQGLDGASSVGYNDALTELDNRISELEAAKHTLSLNGTTLNITLPNTEEA